MTSRIRDLTRGVGTRMVQAVARNMRSMGQSFDKMGAKMEVAKFSEKLVPSTRFVAVDGVMPQVSNQGSFIAPSASLIGDVNVDKNSSVWYGAIVRGDMNEISIGKKSHVMDKAVVTTSGEEEGSNTTIGNNVVVGSCATVTSATIHDGCIIGEASQILSGAVLESNTMIQPGSVVPSGTTIPSGELWGGNPANKVRDLSADEIRSIAERVHVTTALASQHYAENEKSYIEIREHEAMTEMLGGIEETNIDRRTGDENSEILGMGQPGRIFNSTLTNPEEGLDLAMKFKYDKDYKDLPSAAPPKKEEAA